jgi:hypothetical protein
MRAIIFIIIAGALVGCVQKPPVQQRFSKPGATNEQFQKDRFECIQAASIRVSGASYNAYGGSGASNVRVDRATLVGCLASRGYVVSPEGEFSAPPGGAVMTVN